MPRFRTRTLTQLAGLAVLIAAFGVDAQTGQPVEATNAAGDKILLYPDGRWEYADPAKRATKQEPMATPAPSAAETKAQQGAPAPSAPAARVREASAQAQSAPSQGGWLFGRRIPPGDPDYDRRSLNPKLR